MKRILFILILLAVVSTSAKAQFTSFGFHAGTGLAVHVDDLSENSPILALNLGAYANFGFTNSSSMLAENFSLQVGLNLIRRGSNFAEVIQSITSVREGTYSAYYIQLPVLAHFKYELPIREPGHYGLLQVGPAVSYGLFGTMNDYKFTLGYPMADCNYKIKNDPVFNHLNRLDANFILGVGYEYQDLHVMLSMDYGFLAVTSRADALRNQSVNGQPTSTSVTYVPMGNNFSLLLSVGYSLPIR